MKNKTPKITIILENFAGMKKVTWTGVPKSFTANSPSEVNSSIGWNTKFYVLNSSEINFDIKMHTLGSQSYTILDNEG